MATRLKSPLDESSVAGQVGPVAIQVMQAVIGGQPSQLSTSCSLTVIPDSAASGTWTRSLIAPSGNQDRIEATGPAITPGLRMMSVRAPVWRLLNPRQLGIPIGAHANTTVGRLAYLITRQTRGDLFYTVKYCLREILRNVAEHSQSDHFLVMAQYWPEKCQVEIAVLDRGIGLRAVFVRKPEVLGSCVRSIRNQACSFRALQVKRSMLRQKGAMNRTLKVNRATQVLGSTL